MNVTLATESVASKVIVHFSFCPRLACFVIYLLGIFLKETKVNGHAVFFATLALQSLSMSNCQPSIGAPLMHFIHRFINR